MPELIVRSKPSAPAPGWRASEHWLVWGLMVLAAWLAWRGRSGIESLAGLAAPALASAAYTVARTFLKRSTHFAALPQGIPMDIDATIDAFIKKFVASKLPATAALQPECDAAIAAAEALAHKALEVYAVKLLAKKAPQLAAALQAAFPKAGV